MSLAQTRTTERTAEKCLDKRQTDPQTQAIGNGTNKVLDDARCSSCKKQFKQQRQQHRLKDDLIYSTYESHENLDSFSLSILSEISHTEYVRQRQISKK